MTYFCSMKKRGKYQKFYLSKNVLFYSEQVIIIKLSFPRLLMRFKEDSKDVEFNFWKNNLLSFEWLDLHDKPILKKNIDKILFDCWRFLNSHKNEESHLILENNKMMNIEKLINWSEISRLLSGSRKTINVNRIPKIHREAINNLLSKLDDWTNEFVEKK